MPIRTLSEAISHYGREAYLLTVAQDGPHTSNVTIEFRDGSIGCNVGKSAAKNIARQPHVSLFWPPLEAGGYAFRQWHGSERRTADRRDGGRNHPHENRYCIVRAQSPTTATGRVPPTVAA